MIYKQEIKPFNEFWLDCDTQMLFSILTSIDEKYLPLTFRNDYEYLMLSARTKLGIPFHEIRLLPDVSKLRENTFVYQEQCRKRDVPENKKRLKTI